MKNNTFYTFTLFFIFLNLNFALAGLEINSSNVKYNDKDKITVFTGNVNARDEKNNKLFSEYAKYSKLDQIIETEGKTRIITSGGYEILSTNVIFNNEKKLIRSDYKTIITDKDGNKIYVDMFDYSTTNSIFFSKGKIKIIGINKNIYNFSEIYIDENKKKIIGTDIKAFLNQESFTVNSSNEPRFFANTVALSENINTFEKGIFTYCKNREGDKCPPWALQSKKIKHDLAKKIIYYENVVLKVYDFPIFFSPKFSHPDPTVKRMSGFLAPTLSNSTTVGTGFGVPYFWNIANDRDLTITPKLYFNENPLMLAEYKQDFKKSSLTIDAGYTQGYKKQNNKKTSGSRTHLFSNFITNFIDKDERNSDLEINLQKVSNDTYFKVYDINSTLVNKEEDVLENSANLTYQNKDFFFGLNPSVYEDTSKRGNLRYEYLLPLNIEKNLMENEKYGFLDLDSHIKIRNFETNKKTNFLVNNFNWKSTKWLNKFGIENYFEGQVKTVNYEADKTEKYKNQTTNSELNSALGYFAKLGLYKNDPANKTFHTLTPKFLLRYAPGHMRNIRDVSERFDYANLFDLNKTNELDVIEKGLSTSIGFEYKKNEINKDSNISNEIFSFSAGQVISEKENMDIPSSTSLDQKFSDVVGESKYKINDDVNLSYNFSLDQSYNSFNYNEVGSNFNFEKVKFNISYLQERNHVGSQEFVKSGVDLKLGNSTELNFSTKRNFLTNSSEFYNLSYNYVNDCLKAGLAYRREFYTDKDIEPSNTLMFTISIIPFAQLNSPSLTSK